MLHAIRRLKQRLDIKLENAYRGYLRRNSKPPDDFIPTYEVDLTQPRTRFPGYIVVLENSDLVSLLHEAQTSLGYKPERIEQTPYNGSSGHIKLFKGSGGHGVVTSEVIDPKSQTLVHRLYVPLNEVVQVSGHVVSR